LEETNNFLKEKIRKLESLNKIEIKKENNNQLKIISKSFCQELSNSPKSSLYQISINSKSINSEKSTIKNSHISPARYQISSEYRKRSSSSLSIMEFQSISESKISEIYCSDFDCNNFFDDISN